MKVLLVDGNNLGWMAYGQAPLTYREERVEVVYVGLNMVRGYLEQFEPDRCVIAWDGGRDKRRLDKYPSYKQRAKKELTPVEEQEKQAFFSQLRNLREVFKNFGLIQYHLKEPKREADDIIYNLTKWFDSESKEKAEYIVISTDTDFYQLIPEGVKVYSPVKKKMIEDEEIKKRFNIIPVWYVAYKAMVGDPSDKLPGVKGLGPKRASWLVQNLLDGDFQPDSLTDAQFNLVNRFFDNVEDFFLMMELIRFMDIEREELKKGRIFEELKSLDDLFGSAIRVLEKYGFESCLSKFETFMRPFELLYLKRNNNG